MNTEKLAKQLGISEYVCCGIVDALDGVGFTEDQIIAIVTAIIRVKQSN